MDCRSENYEDSPKFEYSLLYEIHEKILILKLASLVPRPLPQFFNVARVQHKIARVAWGLMRLELATCILKAFIIKIHVVSVQYYVFYDY